MNTTGLGNKSRAVNVCYYRDSNIWWLGVEGWDLGSSEDQSWNMRQGGGGQRRSFQAMSLDWKGLDLKELKKIIDGE